MIPLVIYHAGCFDGFCAAWVFAQRRSKSAEFLPAQYGDKPPDVTKRDVYILDFSYPRDVLIDMARVANSILVLDHHESARDALEGLDFCRFDMSKSGARMTWEYFCGDEPSPWLVDFTEDRDLWRWKLPDSREVSAALRSYPMDFALWDEFNKYSTISKRFFELVAEGRAILRAQKQIIDGLVAQAYEAEICGHKILCVNATCFPSEIAGALAKDKLFGACWFEDSKGERVYSLRSAPDGMNVAEIAKVFGGGGHPHAAGFRLAKGAVLQ